MIRILHVVPSLNINSGMMSVIMNYYRSIDRTEIQFYFLYFSEMKDSHGEEIERLGGKTFFIKRPTFKPRDQKELRQFFNEHKGEYHAVHCHPIWSSIVVAKEAKRSGITHVIQHAHSTKYSEKKWSAIRNKVLICFMGFYATEYIACNNEAMRLFGRGRVRKGRVYVLPNAIDTEKYTFDEMLRSEARAEINAMPDTIVLGNIGRLAVEKNQCFTVEVFNAFRNCFPDSKLVLVGDGPYRKQVEKRITALGLEDKVQLTGKRRDIRRLLSGMDLFIMPSLFEGTPVSAVEARTAGLPCLLSDTITKGVDMDGVRFLPIDESPERWAEEALKLAEEWKNHDRSDYDTVVEHGFDIKTEAVKLQDYYLGLG